MTTTTPTMPTAEAMAAAADTFKTADQVMLADAKTALTTIQSDFNNALNSIKTIRSAWDGPSATYTQQVLDGYVSQFTSYKQAVDSMVTNIDALIAQNTVTDDPDPAA